MQHGQARRLPQARVAGRPERRIYQDGAVCQPMPSRIELVEGDIVSLEVDAIVNAANRTLLGGGGVDGAIHRAAGPGLLAECGRLAQVEPGVRCPTGEARITRGHDLPARWVIHTVGPVWQGGGHGEAGLLASCYRDCLALATQPEYAIGSIAFPSISAGVYGYPMELAARVALGEARRHLAGNADPARVLFVCFGQKALEIYQATAGKILD